MIIPYFKNRHVPICFSADENYVPYLCVAIQSVIENTLDELNYDIVVLYEGLSFYHVKNIESLSSAKNISVRCYDVKEYMKAGLRGLFETKAYYTLATYYRFFIPDIFKKYKKVLYLDCDIIALQDVSVLLDIDLGDNFVGAVRDLGVVQQINTIDGWEKYFREDLKINNLENIFQAGVLIFNVVKFNDYNLLEKCVEKIHILPNPRVLDQCILNSVCEYRVHFLEPEWNVMWNLPFLAKDLKSELGGDVYEKYMEARRNPYILHYASFIKPWFEPDRELASFFWNYARRTPYYESILFLNLIHRKVPFRERFFNFKFLHQIYRILPNSLQGKLSEVKIAILK
ncbi:glycosyltransferase family 8 protein [Desulfovibrio gilichinskyi]|uniref:Lipopolysaccharide biosynthesis protein, LPS:glycosyltransferase n=1 Tax=Desulfovibrio gilichinskyi TaxID=1519643 RepID=A0A1X7EIY9_9BACT|nr:glycosyltransferase family 8 protein [Desulfovibrio gilichinskyi]SMF34678.1 Lipopolysaccharide biosynthesis protein, LPS:glycosyltransferase [Desulfovibrio gilichinskyi]